MNMLAVSESEPRRQEIEAFIRDRYRDAYGAELESLPSKLVAARDRGRIACAAGLRTATDGFFCEVYFDVPAEQLIGSRIGRSAPRSRLLEVTSLCSTSPLLSISFLRAVARYGVDNGFEWSIFVATARLRRLLSLLEFEPLELAPASADRIPNRAIWGSYYETAPVVMAVHRTALSKFGWSTPSLQSPAECLSRGCALYRSLAELGRKAGSERQAA
jgi:hypothetical protein